MTDCTSCGARLPPADVQCPYCGASTPYAAELNRHARDATARAEAEARANEAARERTAAAHAAAEVARNSTLALVVAFAGNLCCCFPIGLVGAVIALRARHLAKAHALVTPLRAHIALALSVLSIFGSVGLGVSLYLDAQEREAKIAELRAVADEGRAAETLSDATACQLAELHLRELGFEGHHSALKNFECNGVLTQDGAKATMEGFRFLASSTEEHVRVCFERGSRWEVVGVRRAASCDEPSDLATPSSGGSRGARTRRRSGRREASPATNP